MEFHRNNPPWFSFLRTHGEHTPENTGFFRFRCRTPQKAVLHMLCGVCVCMMAMGAMRALRRAASMSVHEDVRAGGIQGGCGRGCAARNENC